MKGGSMRNFGLLTGLVHGLVAIAHSAERANEGTRRFSQSIASVDPVHRSRGKGRGNLPNGRWTSRTRGRRDASLRSRSNRQKASKKAKARRRA